MVSAPVYLDYNATAPIRPAAETAVLEAMRIGANPSSVHAAGRRARAMIEGARESVAALVGAAPREVVFTSGGTEANAIALLGAVQAGLVSRLIVSAIEHDGVIGTARIAAERFGVLLEVVRAGTDGRIDLADLERALAAGEGRALVSIMAANNETGVLQPLEEIARLARAHGALVHTDAVQMAGKLAFDISPFDLVAISAHKVGGPAGAGALIVRNDTALVPLRGGGKQENGIRPGTEPLAAIAGFGAAAREAQKDLALAETHARWRDAMEARLASTIADLVVFGAEAPRLPQTSCLGLPGVAAETQVIALDLAGFAVSAGAACSSGKVRMSPVLSAMGRSDAEARSAIRVSFGAATTENELHQFTDAWTAQLTRSREVGAARPSNADSKELRV